MATTQKVPPEQILEALATHPGATSAELAEALGIGQSTAAKHLTYPPALIEHPERL